MKTLKKKIGQNFKKWLLLFLISAITSFGHSQRLTVKSGKIVKDGNPITLRGVNFGNWLLWEGYMMDLDKNGIKTHTQIRNGIKGLLRNNETKIKNFETKWRKNYITNSDFKEVKNKGFNVIRVPFDYRMFWNSSTKKVKNDGFKWLDRALSYANNNQIYVIFCMHAAPGFQNPDHHSNNPGTSVNFWKSDWSNVNIAKKVWAHIANRYKNRKGEKWLAGYDLLNEPVLDKNKSRLKKAYKEMTAAIRSKDKNHLIFAEGNYYSSDFYDMLERWDTKLVFSNHYYGPQGESNPNPNLNTIKNQGAKLGIPIFCGEFGENTNTWLGAARTDYDTQNIGWAFWAWKRQDTDRAIYSFGSTSNWDKITNYLRNKNKKPNLAVTEKGLNEILRKIKISNATFKSDIHRKLIPNKPSNKYIWLRNGGKYVTSNNGKSAMKANKNKVGNFEKFKVVNTSDNKIALLGSNNRYVNSQNGTKAITCTSKSIGGWEAFEWIEVDGKVALKGFNGKFISAEGGTKGMTCNRETVSGWEAFDWKRTSNPAGKQASASKKDIVENIGIEEKEEFLIYQTPTSDLLHFKLNSNPSKSYEIEIYNIMGMKVIRETNASKSIDLSKLETGNYIFKIKSDSNKVYSKLFTKR